MDDDERKPVSGTIQLTPAQWKWLRDLANRNFSRSISAELRRLVAAAMEEEARQGTAAA